jgi:hypothetical protein
MSDWDEVVKLVNTVAEQGKRIDELQKRVDAAIDINNSDKQYIEKREAKDRWIPVTERLPDKGAIVLLIISGVVQHETYLCTATPNWDLRIFACVSDESVFLECRQADYWMPLPEPPEADK